MTDKKISDLTALATPATDDEIAIVDTDASSTKKITVANLIPLTEGVPSGTINGSNTAFTITAPTLGFFLLILNGAVQTPGGEDYTRSGSTVTYATAPPTGSSHRYWAF